MPEINEHVVLETNDLEHAQTVRSAILNEFAGCGYWVCIVKGNNNRITLANNWGGRLRDDEAQPVIEFVGKYASA